MKRQAWQWIVALGIASTMGFLAIGPVQAARDAQPGEATAELIKDWLASDSLWLRGRANRSAVTYVECDDGLREVIYEPSRLFDVPANLRVTARSVKGNAERGFKVRLTNQRFGEGTLHLKRPAPSALSAADAQAMLTAVFLRDSTTDGRPSLVGNRASGLLHVAACNHLPPVGDRESLPSVDRALAAGYRQCPLCFSSLPRLTGSRVEHQLGLETARIVRTTYAFAPDDSLQHRLSAVGDRVLSRWITPLKGYHYRFAVIEFDELNAIACPAGTIYFTSALMRSLETDAELEAVVAHEIAHVELRHGYRQYRSAMRGKLIAGLAAVVIGVAVGSQSNDAQLGLDVLEWVAKLGIIATQIVLAGYSREHEAEADDFAMVYLRRRPDVHSAAPLTAVLAKLRYAAVMSGEIWPEVSAFSTHPDLDTRLSRIGEAEFAQFDSTTAFWGCNRDGEILLTLRVVSQSLSNYRDYYFVGRGRGMTRNARPVMKHSTQTLKFIRRTEYRLFTTVESTVDLAERVQLRSMIVRAGGRDYRLSNSEGTEVFPVDEASAVFMGHEVDSLISAPIEGIQLPVVPGIRHWIRAGDEEALQRLQSTNVDDRPSVPDNDRRRRRGMR